MAVTFVTPISQTYAGSVTSRALAFTGVTSGQPIIFILLCEGATGTLAPTFSSTFATEYTYTLIGQCGSSAASKAQMYAVIMTGGAGTSGTVTVAGLTSGSSILYAAMGVACIGASTAAGLGCLESYSVVNTGSTAPPAALTPAVGTDGAVGCAVQDVAGSSFVNTIGAPWGQSVSINSSGYPNITTYPSPTAGTSLATTGDWTWAVGGGSITDNVVTILVKAAVTSLPAPVFGRQAPQRASSW